MNLITGKEFDRIRLEPYHGLIVEFQPEGDNALRGSPTIGFSIGFLSLSSGRIGLSIQLPSESAYRSGTTFVLVNDTLDADKMVLRGGLELEKLV